MMQRLRNTLIAMSIGLALLAACSRTGGSTSVNVRFYPTETATATAAPQTAGTPAPAAAVNQTEPTSAPAATAAQGQSAAVQAAATASASSTSSTGDQVDQMLQKLDDSLNKTDMLQDVP